ncbi:hypothetical protein N7478_005067 [Penicillium angulare]|uniref:uncharacterized protein n=1 Tax=Penicillium angulare TaxID=116970 RepID=UPI0025418E4A|nr:uncharacterized protein N7478_005067 [Penicillium angulare]KAJ5279695.1 hypothetical protein N7478_005067 [Penicillium angulare]
MDWLKKIFTGKDDATIAKEKKNKRLSKEHNKRVRARETQLRQDADGGGAKNARLFFGSQGITYDHARHGKRPKEDKDVSGFLNHDK